MHPRSAPLSICEACRGLMRAASTGRPSPARPTIPRQAARWFLCFWASCVSVDATQRLWDMLFVLGPPATMRVALACLHAVEQCILSATDLGTAISAAKEVLVTAPGTELVQSALYVVAEVAPRPPPEEPGRAVDPCRQSCLPPLGRAVYPP